MSILQTSYNRVFVTPLDSHRAYALKVGTERQESAERKNSVNHYPEQWPGQFMRGHYMGCLAELVVAYYLNLDTKLSCDAYNVPDIDGTRIDVRWSSRRDLCKVKPVDIQENRVVIATTGNDSLIEIIGWIMPYLALKYGKKARLGNGWIVPETYWNPIQTLTPYVYSLF